MSVSASPGAGKKAAAGKASPSGGAWAARAAANNAAATAAAPVAAAPAPAPTAAPAAAAASSAAFSPSLPPAGQLLPGAHLRIRTSAAPDSPFDGVLFVYDASAGLLIVERAYDFADERNEHNRADGSAARKDYAMITVQHAR